VLIMTLLGLHFALATIFWYFCERPFLNKTTASHQINAVPGAARTA